MVVRLAVMALNVKREPSAIVGELFGANGPHERQKTVPGTIGNYSCLQMQDVSRCRI